MGTEMNKRTPGIVFIALVLFASQALAQDAGSVSFASGDVTAERQPATKLAKGDTVFATDAIITGAASRAQLVMSDGAKIAMRPDSRIVIDEYVYAAATSTGSAVSTTDDSSVISLVKGGFRSITGAIGKDNPQNYEVRTAVGVLGIRGTNFAVLLCGNCDISCDCRSRRVTGCITSTIARVLQRAVAAKRLCDLHRVGGRALA